MSQTTQTNSVKVEEFYSRLSERVSGYNARLMLRSALFSSGFNALEVTELSKEDAKTLCLELIKKGGPSFQVGKDMYQLVQ